MKKSSVFSGSLIFLCFTLFLQLICTAQKQEACVPSSCGKITNISYPFRLKHDPPNCGNPSYELACENNITVLYFLSGRYHVESINYNNGTIRLADPSVQQTDCSSVPYNFLSHNDFIDSYRYGSGTVSYYLSYYYNFQFVIYLNCSNPVSGRDYPEYVDTSSCINWNSNRHIYAIAGDLQAQRLNADCRVMMVALTSFWGSHDNKHNESISYTDIHRALAFGFEVSWSLESLPCISRIRRFPYFGAFDRSKCGIWQRLVLIFADYAYGFVLGLCRIVGRLKDFSYDTLAAFLGVITGQYLIPYLVVRFLFGLTILILFLIFTWRRRHISMYGNIEEFLQGNNLMPIRYSYKEIKNMTRGFKDKLGEGGFGSVYKGKLRSGPFVAVKILDKAKANGQEFISEVATIGRIHHVNVVRLVGFCFEGSKCALVYDFMSNGSLDKYIFSNEGSVLLNYEKMYEISLGVARGIAYLHQGCDMQILHFDIKPHNILLDENFIPKISDFGLAKLYRVDNSIVTLTAARGTIGYMAPELFYKNIGGVSFKVDVYSFGMLLMEMTSRRKNLNQHAEHESQLYFPLWIYDQFNEDKDIEMENITGEEKKATKKMFIIALWCIQLKPRDRPSMNRVVEMLEGEIESLEMPPKPTLYPHETIAEDVGMNFGLEASSDFTDSNTNVEENAFDPLLENSI